MAGVQQRLRGMLRWSCEAAGRQSPCFLFPPSSPRGLCGCQNNPESLLGSVVCAPAWLLPSCCCVGNLWRQTENQAQPATL